MTSVALNSVLGYLESLNLTSSNKKWLAEHYFTSKSEEVVDDSDAAFFSELAAMPRGDEREAAEVMADIRAARQSGVTRSVDTI